MIAPAPQKTRRHVDFTDQNLVAREYLVWGSEDGTMGPDKIRGRAWLVHDGDGNGILVLVSVKTKWRRQHYGANLVFAAMQHFETLAANADESRSANFLRACGFVESPSPGFEFVWRKDGKYESWGDGSDDAGEDEADAASGGRRCPEGEDRSDCDSSGEGEGDRDG